ncbi:hypothetical protein HRG_013542 [Hirsutella rhossiliensis]
MQYYYPFVIPIYPPYVRPPSRPRLISTCDLLPQLCQRRPFHRRALFAHSSESWLLPTSGTWGGRANRPPHTSNHTLGPSNAFPPTLRISCSINICHSTSSSNSQKAAGDNMSTVSSGNRTTRLDLLPRHHQRRINGLHAKATARIPLPVLLVLVTNSHPPPQVVPYIRLHRVPIVDSTRSAPASLSRTQCPSNYRRPSKRDPCNTTITSFFPSLSFVIGTAGLSFSADLPTLTLLHHPYSTSNPGSYFTHDHRTRWSRLFKNLASSFPHTPASDLSSSSKKTCFIGCPPPLCVTPHLHFHGDYICHVLTMSASQLNPENAGADMSMMAFVQPGCPARFAYQNEHRVKGLNAETLARVFLPTPSWLSTPEYAAIRSDTGNPSTCIFFSLNISIYNQQIISSEWTEQWFFMVGRVHPFALTWEIERRDGLESDDDNITEYTVPALIVRDHSYQPIVTRTLSSVDTFPTIQPIVSFMGPVIGSGRDLLHGNSAAALDDTQLSCCGFVQLSTFICPGIPGKPLQGLSPFQVFKMTERRDSQFQSNALFTCTGKIAGLLDHQIMKHAPAFDQDYIFIVVPDTWTFHDKAMSDQASATQLLPTTPKSAAAQSPASPRRMLLAQSILMLASSRSMPDPYQTPTKRPRLSPETSTIITDCDGQDSPKSDTSSFLSPEDPAEHIRLWLYQTSRVDIFPTTARPTSAQEYSLNFKASNETIQHDNMSHHPQNQLPKARIAHSLLFFLRLLNKISLQRPSLPPRRSVSVSLTIMLYVSRRVSYLDLTLLPPTLLRFSCRQISFRKASLREPRLASLPLVEQTWVNKFPECLWPVTLVCLLARRLDVETSLKQRYLVLILLLKGFKMDLISIEKPAGDFVSKRKSVGKAKTCLACRSQCNSHVSSVFLTPTPDPEADLLRRELKGMLVYRLATRDPEPSPHRQRSYGNFTQLGGYSESQRASPSSRLFRTLAPSPTIQPTTHPIASDSNTFTHSQDDASKTGARAKQAAIQRDHHCVTDSHNVPTRLVYASQDRLQLIGLLDGDEFSESDIDAEDYFNLLLSPARPRRYLKQLGGTKTRTAMMITWMETLFAIACGSIRHSQGLAAVVLPPVQEGGRDNLEGKLDRRGRHDSAVFHAQDPAWNGDLDACALTDRDKTTLRHFAVDAKRDAETRPREPYFFSANNQLDFGPVPARLPELTPTEESLIARVHAHVNIMLVRGQQYKYRGHVVHFLREVAKARSSGLQFGPLLASH